MTFQVLCQFLLNPRQRQWKVEPWSLLRLRMTIELQQQQLLQLMPRMLLHPYADHAEASGVFSAGKKVLLVRRAAKAFMLALRMHCEAVCCHLAV